MATVSLQLFKKHTNVDFDDDDTLLQHYLDTAQSAVIRYTRRTSEELNAMGGGSFPVELVQAIYTLGAHWYNMRESVSNVQMHEVPDSLQSLVKPFRKLT